LCVRNAGVEGSNPFISTKDFKELGHGATWPVFFFPGLSLHPVNIFHDRPLATSISEGPKSAVMDTV